MKKAELHNIQFKKSQIQWNPIARVCNWKGSGYCASQSHIPKNHTEQIHYVFQLHNPCSKSYNGVPP